ncbi:hypothetical protein V1264_024721 [Littorina saxatilis]|uniref:Fibronectin type-III domain-containing protein n=1 Tax=Littorina saxatilis TaxID=31220 RepID=A0AAN9AL49_9CAEN
MISEPAVPGSLTATQYPGPVVTLQFAKSAGHVDRYDVTLEPGTRTGSATNPQNGGLPSVEFPALTPGTFYTVTIVAVITGPNVESEPSHGEFRVKANSSGKVDSLSVRDTGSRWVEASWQKPLRPNGAMTGYVVVALVSSTQQCASAITFRCGDCTNSMTEQNATLTSLRCGTPSIQNTTSAELNSLTTEFTGNLTGLLPDLSYTVRVYPYNAAGEGAVDERNLLTNEEPAEPLQTVTAVPGGVGQLNVTWVPGVRTGDTNYTVTWKEKNSLTSDQFTLVNSITITGYDNQKHQINGLLSYWEYRVSVQASAPLGASDSKTDTARTRSSEPGKLKEVNVIQPNDTAQELRLRVICPEERQRNGEIKSFIYRRELVNGSETKVNHETAASQLL